MVLYQLTIPKDDSWEVVNELGTLGGLHFVNLNGDEQVFNLPFAH